MNFVDIFSLFALNAPYLTYLLSATSAIVLHYLDLGLGVPHFAPKLLNICYYAKILDLVKNGIFFSTMDVAGDNLIKEIVD